MISLSVFIRAQPCCIVIMNDSFPAVTWNIAFGNRIILSTINSKGLRIYTRFKGSSLRMFTSPSEQARRFNHTTINLLNLTIYQRKLIILLKLLSFCKLSFLLRLISLLTLLILFRNESLNILKIELLKRFNLFL